MKTITYPATFQDIRTLMVALPEPDKHSAQKAREREQQLTKPTGSLGRLEEIAEWLSAWQKKHPPSIQHPVVCVFAGSHGVAEKGVSAYPSSVNRQMLNNFTVQGAAINALCRTSGCEFRVFELTIDTPTEDFMTDAAMDETSCMEAFVCGMKAVSGNIDLLAPGELGIGNTTPASAIFAALYGGAVKKWVGVGSGVTSERFQRKIEVVEKGLEFHKDHLQDPLEVLRRVGGREIAAMAGVILAARLQNIPVILDGYICCSAAAILHALNPKALDHCLAGHLSAEGAHADVLDKFQKTPLLSLGMRLGEGSGAVLAMAVVRAAVETHTTMATFTEAGVDGKI